MASLAGSEYWFGGWENRTGGRINPLGLARGLAAAAIRAGATVHTHSPVRSVARDSAGAAWVVETPRGRLLADRVVIGTQAYTGDFWPGLKRSVVPVRSYQMATSVLSDNVRKTILPEGHALSDTRGDLHFFRFDANGRLVTGGGLILPLGWEGRIRARIAERVRRVFPQIGDGVRFDYQWWGHLAATDDRKPHVFELAPGVLAWMGCNGRGVALGVALGRELARASAGTTALRDIAAPVEKGVRAIRGHVLAPIGTAATVAMHRWRDRRD
jgi:glycine/D-amino acid oxidase-like deaminating enzyme